MYKEHQNLKDSRIRGDFYKTKEDMGDIQSKKYIDPIWTL